MKSPYAIRAPEGLDFVLDRGGVAVSLERVGELLGHKGEPYRSHLEDYFRHGPDGSHGGLEWRFYLACDGALPVANVCTWENCGVGLLGHVYTRATHRRRGIARALLEWQAADFRKRGGRVMALNTEPGSYQERFYGSLGYRKIGHVPGAMLRDLGGEPSAGSPRWEAAHFTWGDWPHLNLLLLEKAGARVRWAAAELWSPGSVESGLLKLWFAGDGSTPPRIRVLRGKKGTLGAFAALTDRSEACETFDFFYLPEVRDAAIPMAAELLKSARGDVVWHIADEDAAAVPYPALGFEPESPGSSSGEAFPGVRRYSRMNPESFI